MKEKSNAMLYVRQRKTAPEEQKSNLDWALHSEIKTIQKRYLISYLNYYFKIIPNDILFWLCDLDLSYV